MAASETHYVALIHKDETSGYGVSFPDVPGVVAVADTLDEAISEAAAALQFAFEDWSGALPVPRSLDILRDDADFQAGRDCCRDQALLQLLRCCRIIRAA